MESARCPLHNSSLGFFVTVTVAELHLVIVGNDACGHECFRYRVEETIAWGCSDRPESLQALGNILSFAIYHCRKLLGCYADMGHFRQVHTAVVDGFFKELQKWKDVLYESLRVSLAVCASLHYSFSLAMLANNNPIRLLLSHNLAFLCLFYYYVLWCRQGMRGVYLWYLWQFTLFLLFLSDDDVLLFDKL